MSTAVVKKNNHCELTSSRGFLYDNNHLKQIRSIIFKEAKVDCNIKFIGQCLS